MAEEANTNLAKNSGASAEKGTETGEKKASSGAGGKETKVTTEVETTAKGQAPATEADAKVEEK